jgi:hypothetical protein
MYVYHLVLIVPMRRSHDLSGLASGRLIFLHTRTQAEKII